MCSCSVMVEVWSSMKRVVSIERVVSKYTVIVQYTLHNYEQSQCIK
jgi:hypothetical protein